MDTSFQVSVCGILVMLIIGCETRPQRGGASNPPSGVGVESVFMTELRALEAVIDFSDVPLSDHGWASMKGREWENFFRLEWKGWPSVHAYLSSTYLLETSFQIRLILTSLKLLTESESTNEDELMSYFMANWTKIPDGLKLITPATQ